VSRGDTDHVDDEGDPEGDAAAGEGGEVEDKDGDGEEFG
jgi:hypothetical protein